MDQKKNRRILKRIDREILDRIMVILYEYGNNKKSVIARKSNMGYDKFVLYLDFLEMFQFIRKETNQDGFEMIGLTDNGIKFCKTKLNERFVPSKKRKTSQLSLV